jgi:hypothetical protein
MDVYESGRDMQPGGCDLAGGVSGAEVADGGNAVVQDADVGGEGLAAGTVEDYAATDDDVEGGGARVESRESRDERRSGGILGR